MLYTILVGLVFLSASLLILLGICYRFSRQYQLDSILAGLCYRRLTVFNFKFLLIVIVWLLSGAYLLG